MSGLGSLAAGVSFGTGNYTENSKRKIYWPPKIFLGELGGPFGRVGIRDSHPCPVIARSWLLPSGVGIAIGLQDCADGCAPRVPVDAKRKRQERNLQLGAANLRRHMAAITPFFPPRVSVDAEFSPFPWSL